MSVQTDVTIQTVKQSSTNEIIYAGFSFEFG